MLERPRWSGAQAFVYAHNFQTYGEVTKNRRFPIIFKNYCLLLSSSKEQGPSIQREGPQASKTICQICIY